MTFGVASLMMFTQNQRCMCGRHGPAFGNAAAEERDGELLCEVLAAAGRRCSLADRQDVLSRHVTGTRSSQFMPCNVCKTFS